MKPKCLKRNIFQRLFGLCATPRPADEGCWTYSSGRIEIDLSRAPELATPLGAFRLEKRGLPTRVLVIHGEDGLFHAFQNRCRHVGRRLDPVPGTSTVQCCSVNKSTYDYEGNVVSGPVTEGVTAYEVQTDEDGRLVITL
jgi:nitrite reductase/ring-hydroxylating ferredoxin subunit